MEIIDVKFKDSDTTSERLIKATQALIALYGYDTTTTRMIANLAGVNLSAINFHFGSKESLVKASLEKAADRLERAYSKMACEIRHFLQQTPVDKEQAWGYLDRFLTDRIRTAFNYDASWINIGLVEHENSVPEGARGIMSKTAVKTSEKVLAELILAVADKKDSFQAAIISRSIMTTIMGYTEKPLMNKYMEELMDVDLGDPRRMEEGLHKYFMQSIQAAVVLDPKAKRF